MTEKEAQSEAPSVEKLLLSVDEDWSICTGDGKCTDRGALYDCDLDQHVMNSDQVKALEAKINRLIKLAKKEERNRLTHQQIDSKIISSDDFKIEFELKFTDEPEHKYVFANSPKGWQVAVDGRNIVSRPSNNLSKGDV